MLSKIYIIPWRIFQNLTGPLKALWVKIENKQAVKKLVEDETIYDEHDVSEDNSCDSDNSKSVQNR